jgi:hypothetical protein
MSKEANSYEAQLFSYKAPEQFEVVHYKKEQ